MGTRGNDTSESKLYCIRSLFTRTDETCHFAIDYHLVDESSQHPYEVMVLGSLEPDHVDTESRSGETESLAGRDVTGSRYHCIWSSRSVACTLGAGQLL